jgi:ubiquinol-cytochrome c reductase cytochrome c1 subunit
MAAVIGRSGRLALLKTPVNYIVPQGNLSFKVFSKPKKILYGTIGAVSAGAVGLGVALQVAVSAGTFELHPTNLKWSHSGIFDSFDHASVRRGYQVYKQVCAACHSMNYMYYRDLVGTIMTEDEAKAEAADVMVVDGPDETGAMFERPGKLADKFPRPYPNDEAAKAANNGALPPDLTFITGARHGGENYVFALLTGYCDPPAGVTVPDGMHYNPYFPGGLIGMAQSLYNEVVEYEDGTPASASQIAKDVSTFLRWACEPEMDERKRMGIKVIAIGTTIMMVLFYWKRHTWTLLKSRKIVFKPRGK